MTKLIHVGDVSLPLQDFAVARSAVLGITRSGKTYGAKGIAEQLLDAGVPIVVFDAIGVWRFLKTPGEGERAKGYPIVIAGGASADLPLTPQSAPEIIRAAIAENIPLVVDLYDAKLSKADWRRIVEASFRTLLYENKGVRHIFLEEAAEYAPQQVRDGSNTVYAEVEKLARMGGNVGLGITIINQRAQEVNKAVLELCDNLVLLRQRGSHAIGALEKWLDRASPDVAKEIARTLPHLTSGECWVWTEESDRPVRTRTHVLRSLHPDRRAASSAAIASGAKAVDTRDFVSKLSGSLAETIERAKADDPKELRRALAAKDARVRELEKQVSGMIVKTGAGKAEIKTVDVPILKDAHLARLEASLSRAEKLAERVGLPLEQLQEVARNTAAAASEIKVAIATAKAPVPISRDSVPSPARFSPSSEARKQEPARAPAEGLTGPEQRILDSIAWLESIGVETPEQTAAAFLAGYTIGGGAWNNPRGSLRTKGLIEYRGNGLALTASGRELARAPESALTTDELHRMVMSRLPGPEQKILRVLLEIYPDSISNEDLAERSGYAQGGGAFNNPRGRLRSLGLVEYPERGQVRARSILFPERAR